MGFHKSMVLAVEPTTSLQSEVELSTTNSAKRCKLAKKSSGTTAGKKSNAGNKKSTKNAGNKKSTKNAGNKGKSKKGRGQSKPAMFNREEKRLIGQVDRGQLRCYVEGKVCSDIVAESFPERAVVWEYIKQSHQLDTIVSISSDKYAELYFSNTASSRDKNAALFLSWLEYVRTWTCNEERVAAVDVQASNATKRTVLAIVFNAIYQGLCHTMAETAEQISISKHVPCDKAKPSDEVAMHRICGWALKSVMDQYKHKVDCTAQQLSFVSMLKLPNEDKHLLPLPAQFLDRGGLTFLRQELWPWMLATKKDDRPPESGFISTVWIKIVCGTVFLIIIIEWLQ